MVRRNAQPMMQNMKTKKWLKYKTYTYKMERTFSWYLENFPELNLWKTFLFKYCEEGMDVFSLNAMHRPKYICVHIAHSLPDWNDFCVCDPTLSCVKNCRILSARDEKLLIFRTLSAIEETFFFARSAISCFLSNDSLEVN